MTAFETDLGVFRKSNLFLKILTSLDNSLHLADLNMGFVGLPQMKASKNF